MFDIICLQKHCLETFFLRLLIAISFHCFLLVCYYFLFLPVSVLEDCTILRISTFLPNYHFFFRHTLACVSLYYPLCFCGVHYTFSFFTSNFINFSPLPNFFLRNNSHYRFSYLSLLSLEICI